MKANQWKEYFLFTKKERIGIITLLIILIGVWFLPIAFPSSDKTDIQKLEAFKAQIAALQKKDTDVSSNTHSEDVAISISYDTNASSLFYFDPNTLSQSEWQKLGLNNKTISTIHNYLSKGGRFRKPEDLSKIYGLKKADYESLVPYIRIASANNEKANEYNNSQAKQYEQKNAKPIDINMADTTAFIALPGIGSKLANRIINFREKLGGFYSVDQIGEVYGLADSVFQKMRPRLTCNATNIKVININIATMEELKAHPYIKYQVANAVIQYRNQHGNYTSVESLKQVQSITDEIFKKIEPYLAAR